MSQSESDQGCVDLISVSDNRSKSGEALFVGLSDLGDQQAHCFAVLPIRR
jgi:hypothetical protein